MNYLKIPGCNFDIELDIFGMMCQKNCGKTVRNVLKAIPSVDYVVVDFMAKKAQIWGRPSIMELITAIENVGFDAKISTNISLNLSNQLILEFLPDYILQVHNIKNPAECPTKILSLLVNLHNVVSATISINEVFIWGFGGIASMINILKLDGYVATEQKVNERNVKDKNDTNTLCTSIDMNDNILTTIELQINSNMTPESIQTISNYLYEKFDNIKSINVFLLLKKVEILFVQSDLCTSQHIILSLKDIEYDTSIICITNNSNKAKQNILLHVSGMTCTNCIVKIESQLKLLNGVEEVTSSCTTGYVRVIIDNNYNSNNNNKANNNEIINVIGTRDVVDTICDLGYDCKVIDETSIGANKMDDYCELHLWRSTMITALILGLPVILIHICTMRSSFIDNLLNKPLMFIGGGITIGQFIMIILDTGLQFGVGYRYYHAATIAAMNGFFGMDFLIIIGTSCTYLYNLSQLSIACYLRIPSTHTFLEASGMLLLFVTLGKCIEAYAKGNSVSAITSLTKMQPSKAHLVLNASNLTIIPSNNRSSDILKEIDISLVKKDDILKIFPGNRIPTDGVIISGQTLIDESLITGESIPVFRKEHDNVFGCTINQSALIYIRVTSCGNDSVVAQIAYLVQNAQLQKAPVQAYADQCASMFTPIVMLLSVMTFMTWIILATCHIIPGEWFEEEYGSPFLFSLLFAISVIVVSCPCALGLATPTAILVGTSVAAQYGILIKGGAAFETANSVDTVIFDKTGTLTEGKPCLTDILVLDRIDTTTTGKNEREEQNKLLRLAATAEQGNSHQISRAILSAAENRNIRLMSLDPNAFSYGEGNGVCCDTDEGRIVVGSRTYMQTNGYLLSAKLDTAMWNLEVQGKTAVCIGLNKQLLGLLGITDSIKTEAYSTITNLRNMGIDVWMVTGDHRTTAESVADELSIPRDHVIAGVFPGEKVAKVESFQKEGKIVAMIGDGVNDAPALAKANLGVAIGAGTQVAIDAADIVLVRDNLYDVVVTIDLARYVFRRIKFNIVWAMVYNVMAIPSAAGVWFPWTHTLIQPHFAGLSMALSSISVVLSSLSLRYYTKPKLESDLIPQKKGFLKRAIRNLGDMNNSMKERIRRYSKFKSSNAMKYIQLPRNESEADLGLELGIGGMSGLKLNNNLLDDDDDSDLNRLI